MRFFRLLFQDEFRPEHPAQFPRIVTDDVQTAASCGTVQRKSGNNRLPPGNKRVFQNPDIAVPVFRIGKKVKGSAVVPKIVFSAWTESRDIGLDPLDQG
jgi:hypothetical protein